MQKILILGTSGSGKSTLGSQLSEVSGIKHTQLDELHWLDNWENRGPEEFRILVDQTTKKESWIICGNYSRIQDLTLGRADTVIWLDYSLFLNLYRVTKRSLKRLAFPESLWRTNCKESFSRTFLSRDSIILWMLQTYKENRIKYLKLKKELESSSIQFIHLRNPTEAKKFLKQTTW